MSRRPKKDKMPVSGNAAGKGPGGPIAPPSGVALRYFRLPPHLSYPFILFCASLALRLIYLFILRNDDYFSTLVIDSEAYHEKALEIMGGKLIASRAFYQDGLYPYILALLYSVFGQSILTARLFNVILSSVSTVLIYGIGRELGGRRAGIAAALLHILCGLFLFYDGILGKEPLGILLVSAALYAALAAGKSPSARGALLAGLCLGLAALTRANLLLFLPVFCAWLVFASKGPVTRRLIPAVFYAAGFFAAVSPASIHNYLAEGDFVLLTSQGGQNFYYGNGPESKGAFENPENVRLVPEFEEEDFRRQALALSGRVSMKSSEVSRFYLRRGLDYVIDHPGDTSRLLLRKAAMFFSALEIADNYSFDFARHRFPVLRALFLGSGLLLCLGLAGFVMLWPDRRKFFVPALFFAVYAGSVIAFHVASRYRLPILPLMCATGGVFLAGLPDALRHRRHLLLGASCAVFAVIAIAVYWPYPFVPRNIESTFDVPYNALGTGAAKRGNHDEALSLYGKALEINPNNAVALYNRAESLRSLGRLTEALADLRRALSLDPSLTLARCNLGMLLVTMNEPESALAVFDEALARNPMDGEAYAGRGLALAALARLSEAESDLGRALALGAEPAPVLYNLACVLAREEKSGEAERTIAEAVKLKPSYAAQAKEDPDLAGIARIY